MKTFATILAVFALAGATTLAMAVEPTAETGFSLDTEIVNNPSPDEGDCANATLDQNDDGSFENGYAWHYAGVAPPDYGSWAECYGNAFVCTIDFLLTDVGYYYPGPWMDVYVWGDAGGNPGNVICVVQGVDPGQPAFWPSISTHPVDVNCCADGPHFVGFWPAWPGQLLKFFIASDENGLGQGCPRTKIAPGIGYPTGWQHPNVVPTFGGCQDLGIREWFLPTCEGGGTATEPTTWGQIKTLY